MVARPTDTPVEVTERLADARKKVEELTRSVGRGTAALRDATDNVLELGNAASPLLRNTGVNLGILYSAVGEIMMVTADGAQYANMRGSNVAADKDIVANQNVRAAGTGTFGGAGSFGGRVDATSDIRSEAGISCAGGFSAGGTMFGPGLKIGDAESPIGGRITTREMTAEGNIFAKGNMYVNGNFIDNTPSERRLKNHKTEIKNGIKVINSLRPSLWTWKDTENRDDKLHAGIYVDELAESAPEAVVEPVNPADVPTEDENFFTDNARNYEDRAVIAYLVAAMQEMHKDYSEYKEKTEKELFDLRCDVDDLKESVRIITKAKRLAN